MNKEEIFKNLKKELNDFPPAEIKDEKEKVFSKNKKKKKKKFKPKTTVDNIKEEIDKNIQETDEFKKFKEDFLKVDEQKDFLTVVLGNLRSQGYTDIENEKYLTLKMIHPQLKALVKKPSFEDISNNITGSVYFIRPLYMHEQTEFDEKFGSQLEKPLEYSQFLLEKCVEYPKLSLREIQTLPAGIALTLTHTISDMSDLTKKFQVLEL